MLVKPFTCLTYSWVVVTYPVDKAISHDISAAAHLIWFYTPRQDEVLLWNAPKFVPVLSCLPLACEKALWGEAVGARWKGRKRNKITLLAFRHFDDASMLNYPKRMTLYKWFDELFGHFSGVVCFNLDFVAECLHLARIKSSVAWVSSVEPEFTVSKGRWNFLNFKPEFLLNRKRPALVTLCTLISRAFPLQIVVKNSHFLSYLGNCYFMFMFRFAFLSFFRSHRSDTLPSRGCLLPIGSLETTASGIRPSRSGAENSFEC